MANLALNRFIREQETSSKSTSTKTTSTKTTSTKPARSGIQRAPEPAPRPRIAPPPTPKVKAQSTQKPTQFEQRLQQLAQQAESFVNTITPGVTSSGQTAAQFFGESPEAARALRDFRPPEPEQPGPVQQFINFLTPGVTTSGQTAAEFFGESPEAARALRPPAERRGPGAREQELTQRRAQIRDRFGGEVDAQTLRLTAQAIDQGVIPDEVSGRLSRELQEQGITAQSGARVTTRELQLDRRRDQVRQTFGIPMQRAWQNLVWATRETGKAMMQGALPNVMSVEVMTLLGISPQDMTALGYVWDGEQWRIGQPVGGPGGQGGFGGGGGGGGFGGFPRPGGTPGRRAARGIGLTMWSI